jgi:hypothetical protein
LTVPTIEAELTQKILSKPTSPNDLEKISNLTRQLEKDSKDIQRYYCNQQNISLRYFLVADTFIESVRDFGGFNQNMIYTVSA